MFRYVSAAILIVVAIALVLIAVSIAEYFIGMNPPDLARYALTGLSIILFMVFIHALAQLIGIFMHTRKR